MGSNPVKFYLNGNHPSLEVLLLANTSSFRQHNDALAESLLQFDVSAPGGGGLRRFPPVVSLNRLVQNPYILETLQNPWTVFGDCDWNCFRFRLQNQLTVHLKQSRTFYWLSLTVSYLPTVATCQIFWACGCVNNPNSWPSPLQSHTFSPMYYRFCIKPSWKKWNSVGGDIV